MISAPIHLVEVKHLSSATFNPKREFANPCDLNRRTHFRMCPKCRSFVFMDNDPDDEVNYTCPNCHYEVIADGNVFNTASVSTLMSSIDSARIVFNKMKRNIKDAIIEICKPKVDEGPEVVMMAA